MQTNEIMKIIKNIVINGSNVTINYQYLISGRNLIVNNIGEETLKLVFQPSFGLGANVIDVKASYNSNNDGDSVDIKYEKIEDSQASVYKFDLDIPPGQTALTIKLNKFPEIYLIATDGAAIGQTNKGLKIISQKLDGNKLITTVEGLGSIEYQLGILGSEFIKKLEGAELNSGLRFIIPGKEKDKFYKHDIIIEFKD